MADRVSSPTPFDNEDLYDHIVLGGKSSPGICTLSGHDRAIDWDVKKGSGQNGATTTMKGVPPVEFEVAFYLVKDPSRGIDEYAEWAEFERVIKSTVAGPTPRALAIYHPDLADRDIKSVCQAKLGGAVYDGKGGKTVKVRLLEYRPPKKTGGTPKGAKTKARGAGAGPSGPDPDAAALAELERLRKQYEATPWQ